jgi:hypothetical protein
VPQNSDHFAIVINNDRYPPFDELNTAAESAAAFSEWLSSANGGGLPRPNIRRLGSSSVGGIPALHQWEIRRAVRDMGGWSGARIGTRLYLYFSGYGVPGNSGDVGLVVGGDTPSEFVGLSLHAVRQWFESAANFDELVFICDFTPAPGLLPGSAPKVPPPPRPIGSPLVMRYLMIAAASTPHAGGPGLLTSVLLEGLRGAAAGDRGVRSSDLTKYVASRVRELSAREGVAMKVSAASEGEIDLILPAAAPRSTLIVELPHPMADVQIFDALFRTVPAGRTSMSTSTAATEEAQSETPLAPGFYEVRVVLQGVSDRRPVLVRPGQTQRVRRTAWKQLRLTASAPLAGAVPAFASETRVTSNDWNPAIASAHSERAEEWSRRVTWRDGGGDSRLFLFARRPTRRTAETFAEGLALCNVREEIVTPIRSGAEINPEAGWLAFTADLPPGFYVLRYGRRCVPTFLTKGWETHVFLTIGDQLTFQTLTMHMARHGTGFVANDEVAVATEVILGSLRSNQSAVRIVTGAPVEALLRRDDRNPWLSLLAASVMTLASQEGTTASIGGGPEPPVTLPQLLDFLGATLPDHPDVRALRLASNAPTQVPFDVPPLLRAGLERVRSHAVRYAATIPLGSLTDRTLSSLITNSPWTAWRVRTGTRAGTGTSSDGAPVVSSVPRPRHVLAAQAPLSAPVFHLDDPETVENEANAPAAQGTAPIQREAARLRDIPLIQTVQHLLEDRDAPSGQDVVNVSERLRSLLGSVSAADVSAATGLPLSRTEEGLARLREKLQTSDSVTSLPPLVGPEQAVATYAWNQAACSVTPPLSGPTLAPAPTAVDLRALIEAPATIEDAIFALQSAAEQLRLADETRAAEPTESDAPASGDVVIAHARPIVKRLERLGEHLLRSAGFVVTTDARGRLLRVNGAFRMLLSPASGISADQRREEEARNWRAWASALLGAPDGDSRVAVRTTGALFAEWDLRRVAIAQAPNEAPEYLNVLRGVGSPRLGTDTVRALDRLISQVSLHASFFAHGSNVRRSESVAKLDAVLIEAERLLGIPATAA